MAAVSVDGIEYEAPDPFVDIEGKRFATGLWIPHEQEPCIYPLASVAMNAGIRDIKDLEAILADPNRTPAEQLFPPEQWTRSQGGVSSCAGYAAAWTLSRAIKINTGRTVYLSGESVYSQTNRGRDMGSALAANIKALVQTGAAPEGLNTPGKFYTERTLPEAAKKERHRFRAFEYHQIKTDWELACASALRFVTCVAIHVGPSWERFNGDMLVGNRGPGNHAVLVDDVRIRNGRFEHRMGNSHGLRWGFKGTAWTTWAAHYASTVENHLFYAIRAIQPDPQSPVPPAI